MNGHRNSPTNDVIGIECEIDHPNSVNALLRFNGIDFENFYFHALDAMVFGKEQIVSVPETLQADDFKKLFEEDPYCPCLNLRVYPVGTAPQKIDTYDDYRNSPCEMIVLVYDSAYVEIYTKNKTWLDTLIQNANELQGERIDLKTPETDGRTEMYV